MIYLLKIIDKVLPYNTIRGTIIRYFFKVIKNPGLILYFFRFKNLLNIRKHLRRKRKQLPRLEVISSVQETKKIAFQNFARPLVSIIIPVWNKWVYTYNCLLTVAQNTPNVSFEVIVIDNASTDHTAQMLSNINNIRSIKNDKNEGFVRACNQGASKAKGQYLLFLNNDTLVTPNWLSSMVSLFKKYRAVGLVGAKLIYPNGKLQEAGGIVWNDPVNLAWNFGKNDDPDRWEYNYVKTVDYCSGACLLVRKDLFHRIGSFDMQFSPAYCEDTDLAFSIRKLGYKVMYQPKAEIVHSEGTTAGKDTSHGFKSYQLVNQKKFYHKWKNTLKTEHFKNGEDLFLARDRSQRKKIMFFADHYVPMWDKDAGSVRMYEYLKIFLNMGFKTIFWPDNHLKIEPYTTDLQELGIEVVYGLRGFKKYIQKYGKYISVAYLSRPHISILYIDHIKKYSKAKLIYDCQDLHFLREQRRAEIEKNPKILKEAKDWKSKEFYLMEKSDVTIVLSEYEKELIIRDHPKINVEILPYVQDINNAKKKFNEKKDIIFIGGFAHIPNEDAVLWFAKEVFPLIKKKIPEIRFIVLGSHPTKKILNLNSNEIIVTDYVENVSPYFQNAKVFIAPLRYGAGLKGKTVHAMSYGLPVVTTSIGAEGMNFQDREDVLIADDQFEFANAVIELYMNNSIWEKYSKKSSDYVRRNCTVEVAQKKIETMMDRLFSN